LLNIVLKRGTIDQNALNLLLNLTDMKSRTVLSMMLLLLLAPFFMATDCNTDLEGPAPKDEFFNWNISGFGTGEVATPPDVIDVANLPNLTAFGGSGSNNTRAFNFTINAPQIPGNYPAQDFTIFTAGKYFVKSGTVTMTITNYGVPGLYIIGSYAGVVRDSAAAGNLNISGTFKIRNQ
jgi:hypothetical protein